MTQTENVFESPEAAVRWRANEERRAAFLRPATERMLKAAGVVPGARVLDLGTGTGDTAILAGRRVGPEGRVLATDVSAAMLAAAAEAIAASGLANVECQRQDASALTGLEPGSFDAVIARFSLQFVPDLAAALAGIRRVLRPGGALGALVWATGEQNLLLYLPVEVAIRTGRLRVPEANVQRPFRLSDAEGLAATAREAGLEAETEEIALEANLPTRDAALASMRNSPTAGLILDALDESERAGYQADLAEALEGHREGDGYRFSGVALLLRGRNLP